MIKQHAGVLENAVHITIIVDETVIIIYTASNSNKHRLERNTRVTISSFTPAHGWRGSC